VVKKPLSTSRPFSKLNRSSLLRTPLDPSDSETEENDKLSVITPKTTSLSRHAIERNARLKSLALERLPHVAAVSVDRPSYSALYLAELKTSTLSAPRDLVTALDVEDQVSSQVLDITSKFGPSALIRLTDPETSLIPTDAEIQEKKARRRRLAQEKDFISLDDDGADALSNSDNEDDDKPRNRSLIIPADEINLQDKYGSTRLVHDDEDMAEGFDSFVEDSGKVTLSRKAAKEQELQRLNKLKEEIRDAQRGSSDSESVDEDEEARKTAYEVAQTKKGMYILPSEAGQTAADKKRRLDERLKLPEKITPIPEFRAVVARFQEMVKAKEGELAESRKRLQRLRTERDEIDKEEVRVKGLLAESAARFETLRGEMGGSDGDAFGTRKMQDSLERQRGLESLGDRTAVLAGMAGPPRDDYDSSDG